MSLGIVTDRLLRTRFSNQGILRSFVLNHLGGKQKRKFPFADFWEFWANHLKLRVQLNHVPVHETHSAKVRKIVTTSRTPSLNRIGQGTEDRGTDDA